MFADDMLVENAVAKIDDGDVILTYAYSTVVFDILVKAHQVGSLLNAIYGTRTVSNQCFRVSPSRSVTGLCCKYDG